MGGKAENTIAIAGFIFCIELLFWLWAADKSKLQYFSLSAAIIF
jgi:hypothetical protein